MQIFRIRWQASKQGGDRTGGVGGTGDKLEGLLLVWEALPGGQLGAGEAAAR